MSAQLFSPMYMAFTRFYAPFAPLFGRIDTRRRSAQYIQSLLMARTKRRNAENLAEWSGAASPRAFQRLLRDSTWQYQRVIDALHAVVAPHLNGDNGSWVLEAIGFSKRGTKSVGVARQRNPTLGRMDNCQIGVFLRYAAARGQAVVDAQLYLPQSWAKNRPRCQAAGVPDPVTYQSQGDLALAMLREAAERGQLASRWVIGGRTFGRNSAFRDALDAGGWWYMLEVPTSLSVVAPSGAMRSPASRIQMIGTLAAQLPRTAWHEGTRAVGVSSAPAYQYAALRVWEYRTNASASECWVLLRRNADGQDLVAYLSNAPEPLTPHLLEQMHARQGARSNNRLDRHNAIILAGYETRSWRGWHNHVTLCLLADAFRLHLQHREQ